MKNYLQKAKAFIRDEDGATAVEYGLMVALIAGVVIVAVTTIGGYLNTGFENVGTTIQNSDPGAS